MCMCVRVMIYGMFLWEKMLVLLMFKAHSGVRTFSASRNASTSSAKSSKAMAWWGEMGWFDQTNITEPTNVRWNNGDTHIK